MTVDDGNTVAGWADERIEHINRFAIEVTEHLLWLFDQLFFFAADIRNNVVDNIERRDAGIACPTGRLHTDDRNFTHAKWEQRRKRHNDGHGGAVGIGDQCASSPAML